MKLMMVLRLNFEQLKGLKFQILCIVVRNDYRYRVVRVHSF